MNLLMEIIADVLLYVSELFTGKATVDEIRSDKKSAPEATTDNLN